MLGLSVAACSRLFAHVYTHDYTHVKEHASAYCCYGSDPDLSFSIRVLHAPCSMLHGILLTPADGRMLHRIFYRTCHQIVHRTLRWRRQAEQTIKRLLVRAEAVNEKANALNSGRHAIGDVSQMNDDTHSHRPDTRPKRYVRMCSHELHHGILCWPVRL